MRDKILNLLDQKGELPPFPKVLLDLQELINDPDCDVDDVRRLIQIDMALTGKLITLSNSAFFRMGREKTGTVEEAIIRLGVNQVLDLCYCLEIPKSFKKIKSFDQTQFWQHSLASGYLSRMFSEKLVDDQNIVNASFMSGMMHDVGILVFNYLIPKEYNNFLIAKDISNSDQPVETLEKATFGVDHQELGAMFLEKHWELPKILVGGTTDHHKDYISSGSINLSHIVSASNKLANENNISHPIMSQHKEELSEDFITKANLSSNEIEGFIEKTKIGLLAFDSMNNT
ncbi:MAG: HD-like signal output (HDOD) protein [Parvicellaceae bacterium]|jgi:HD-like signal output (HDOD) protein